MEMRFRSGLAWSRSFRSLPPIRSFSPVGAQISYKIERTCGENGVFGMGHFECSFERIERIGYDVEFGGEMASHLF